jgi:hypothetical protein
MNPTPRADLFTGPTVLPRDPPRMSIWFRG